VLILIYSYIGRVMNKVLNDYLSNFKSSLEAVDIGQIEKVSNLMLQKREMQNTIYIAGNGGSAACAEHMAVDLMFGTKISNLPLRTVCLSSNSSSLTATGNDVDFESIFSRQVKYLGKTGDLLVVISASGNSLNLIQAVKEARKVGMDTIGLLGFDGGQLLDLVDYAIHVKTPIGAYGISEDLHLLINHLLVENIKGIVSK
jgi:D-sedoheptulose 7-phosphate isomerase